MRSGQISQDHSEQALILRATLVPILTTVAGSMLSLLPVVALSPALPPFGLLVLLGWRLLRPEHWPSWMALPLGLADDLIGGQPLGSAAALWTITFLALDLADNRMIWRDYWIDWLAASVAILFCVAGGWALAAITGGGGTPLVIVPQAVLSIFCFPAVARLCALLDRWRLGR